MQFTELKPLHSYARLPPNLFNFHSTNTATLRAYYRLFCQERVECPAEGYTVIDHCYIYDGCHVMTPDLEWVPDTVVDYGIAEKIKPVIQDVIRGCHHRELDPSPFKTVVIAKAGADNYGHVLTDILPKLVNIARSGLSAIRLLLPTGMRNFAGLVSAVLAQAGVQAELEFHAPATLKEAREVYLFSPVGRHNARKSTTFLELADRLASLYDIRLARSRRIYVRRGPDEKRGFQHAADVEALFVQSGYESVYPAELPIEEQIRLFAAASHVAGALGAGMANIGWAPPGCDVLMIDPGIGDLYFWDFSCLLNQRFSWLFAARLTGYTAELARNHYDVDLQLLGSTLSSLYG